MNATLIQQEVRRAEVTQLMASTIKAIEDLRQSLTQQKQPEIVWHNYYTA